MKVTALNTLPDCIQHSNFFPKQLPLHAVVNKSLLTKQRKDFSMPPI